MGTISLSPPTEDDDTSPLEVFLLDHLVGTAHTWEDVDYCVVQYFDFKSQAQTIPSCEKMVVDFELNLIQCFNKDILFWEGFLSENLT